MLILDGIELKTGMKLRLLKNTLEFNIGHIRTIKEIDIENNKISFTDGASCTIGFVRVHYEVLPIFGLILDGIELKSGMSLRAKKNGYTFRRGDIFKLTRIEMDGNRLFFMDKECIDYCHIDFAQEYFEVVKESKLTLDGIELKIGMKLRAKKDYNNSFYPFKKDYIAEIQKILIDTKQVFFTDSNFFHIEFMKEYFEVVQEPKFKPGDKVKIVKVHGLNPDFQKYNGQETEIIGISNNPLYPYRVKGNKHIWSGEELELIIEKENVKMEFKVGDKIMIHDGSWAFKIKNNEFETVNGHRMSQKRWTIIAINVNMPAMDYNGFLPEQTLMGVPIKNDLVIKADNDGEIAFVSSKYVKIFMDADEITLQEAIEIWVNGDKVRVEFQPGDSYIYDWMDIDGFAFSSIKRCKLYKIKH